MKKLLFILIFLAAACTQVTAPHILPAQNGSIFVDDGGRGGVPVVFVHGNGGSSAQWRAQLEHLRATRRAIAIDLPGFGKSSAPANGDYSLGAMSSAIDDAVKDIGVRRFVIVGHSYAGAVIAKYAAEHPGKIAGVVYVDAAAMTLTLSDEQKSRIDAALRADKMQVVRAMFAPMLKPSSAEVQTAVLHSVEQTSTDAFIGALMSLLQYDAQSLVRAYPGPKLAIVASDIESPASFSKQFPDVQTVRISGAGHWLMLDKPSELNAALDAFLAEIH